MCEYVCGGGGVRGLFNQIMAMPEFWEHLVTQPLPYWHRFLSIISGWIFVEYVLEPKPRKEFKPKRTMQFISEQLRDLITYHNA